MSRYVTQMRDAVSQPRGMQGCVRQRLRIGILSALAAMRQSAAQRFLRCLYCHYVFDDQVADFERVLTALKQVGTFVDTDVCLRMARGEQPVDGRYFHLSFDDGFRNNFTNAVPILKKLQVPCLFFVPSGFVGCDFEASRRYCLETTGYQGVIEMLTWRDLEAMLEAGCEIGSHTRTHARFSEISGDAARMRDEIAASKEDMERHLGVPCRTISWPYGRIADADGFSLEMVKSCGYEACFGAFRGTVEPAKTNLFAIPRHHFELQWPLSHVMFFARGHGERKRSIANH